MAAFVMMAALVAGCSPESPSPEAASPSPTMAVPKAGDCYVTIGGGSKTFDLAKDCLDSHNREVAYVAEITGPAAAAPPAVTDASLPVSFGICDQKVAERLGSDWRPLRAVVTITVPRPSEWEQGARWVRCDVDFLDERLSRMTAIDGSGRVNIPELSIGCFRRDAAKTETFVPVDCREPHNWEFAGATDVAATSPFRKTDDAWPEAQSACERKVQAFVGVSAAQYAKAYRARFTVLNTRAMWDAGDRTARCFLDLGRTTMTGSAQGRGTKVPRYS
ncbi:MAG: hypothetical protein HOV77_26600 [Hamadaea sp.]|uniref:septum formation family protein n=1 Tax=Hamadaea sp. TaxID=2024425 RepID=UPI001809B70D|nr:septum formation family protein [Hamadaea sp.]NUT22754.1 hypothetical protein [Hamadaea sp.]